jgi:PPK2 family polyphosphate:nucleotide phosphotransferase
MARGQKPRPPRPPARLSDLLRVPPSGSVDLAAIDTRSTPGFAGTKPEALADITGLAPLLAGLQERLFAEGRTGRSRRLLVVLQGMDTSGKDGTIRHVFRNVDPQGCEFTAFKEPTKQELAHTFLWRIRRRLPQPGVIGVFNRSHYEDVVTVRVRGLVPEQTWSRRFAVINRFEKSLVDDGFRVVKVFLHISREEQRARLMARLEDPAKRWKYNPGDVDERALWDRYQAGYTDALVRCTTEFAPWRIVPADRKWYRNWSVTNLLVEQLEEMDPRWPVPTFDVEAEKARLLSSP